MASHVFAANPWELLTEGSADENSTKRALAIAALGTVPTARAEKLVEAALMDKNSTVRLSAVSALAAHSGLRRRDFCYSGRLSGPAEKGSTGGTGLQSDSRVGDHPQRRRTSEVPLRAILWRPAVAWNPKFDSGILSKLFPSGKTVIRAGYGRSLNRINGINQVQVTLQGAGI